MPQRLRRLSYALLHRSPIQQFLVYCYTGTSQNNKYQNWRSLTEAELFDTPLRLSRSKVPSYQSSISMYSSRDGASSYRSASRLMRRISSCESFIPIPASGDSVIMLPPGGSEWNPCVISRAVWVARGWICDRWREFYFRIARSPGRMKVESQRNPSLVETESGVTPGR
jgi:hypothetical protein